MITKRIISAFALATVALVAVLAFCRYAGGEQAHDARQSEPLPVTPESAEPDDFEASFDLAARADEIRREEAERRARERAKIFDVLDAIDKLQPYYSKGHNDRARSRRNGQKARLAHAINDAAKRYRIDPLIAVAMARRESSLHPIVGYGKRDGALGERGYFQIFPNGYAERVCGLDNGARCNQYDEQCNARTAMCWLAKIREQCGDDPWIYVGGYGRTRCPRDRDEAQRWAEVVTARDFYCEIADCERGWPM